MYWFMLLTCILNFWNDFGVVASELIKVWLTCTVNYCGIDLFVINLYCKFPYFGTDLSIVVLYCKLGCSSELILLWLMCAVNFCGIYVVNLYCIGLYMINLHYKSFNGCTWLCGWKLDFYQNIGLTSLTLSLYRFGAPEENERPVELLLYTNPSYAAGNVVPTASKS